MRVLITGATGFIGARLAIRCREQDMSVIALGQDNTDWERRRSSELQNAGVDVRLVSILDQQGLRDCCRGVDVVFHLAAAQHEMGVPDSHFYSINVDGTSNMLEAAVSANVRRFVHGSTIGVYGSAMVGELDEQSDLHPDNIYGVTKLAGEKLALQYIDRLPVTVARISETYGPGDGRLLKLFRAIARQRFFMIGSGENRRQLIFVDDLIEGMLRMVTAEEAIGQIYVLAGAEVMTTNEMVARIARALDVAVPRWRVPLWPLAAVAWGMERTLRPLGIDPPLHRRRLDFFRKSFYFSRDKAGRDLQFEPRTSFAEGARVTADWYRSTGMI